MKTVCRGQTARRVRTLCLLLLLLLGGVTMLGCTREKYAVDYCGRQADYRGARDAYRAGQTVKLYYDWIGTDTDYSFLLDGQNLNCTFHRNKGFLIRFVMPAHDVKLECRTERSMVRDGDVPTVADRTVPAETERDTTIPETQPDAPMRAASAPPVTAAKTAPTTAAAAGAYGFTARYIQTGSAADEADYPLCLCIDSKPALDAYLAENAPSYRGSERVLREAAQSYDDAWFSAHELLLVVLEEGSGAVRHTVTRVAKTAPDAGAVSVRRDVPQVGTCDMAYWHIWIELDAGVFAPSDDVRVILSDQ